MQEVSLSQFVEQGVAITSCTARGEFMSFLVSLIFGWIKDSQFHKTAASAAAGSSIGILTAIGILEQKIDSVKAEVKSELVQVQNHVSEIDSFVKHRKEITDERFQNIDHSLKYLRGAIDVTNQNVLNLSHDLKRSR